VISLYPLLIDHAHYLAVCFQLFAVWWCISWASHTKDFGIESMFCCIEWNASLGKEIVKTSTVDVLTMSHYVSIWMMGVESA